MKKVFFVISIIILVIFSIQSCRKPDEFENIDYNEWLSGGSQTVFDESAGAFGNIFPNLSSDKQKIHQTGDAAFEATFISAPAPINSGLGPVFNNVSCASCHIADGRGKPPVAGEALSSMLFRISVSGVDIHGGPNPVAGYGGQFQQRSILGIPSEGHISIQYTDQQYQFKDGQTYTLHYPVYQLDSVYTTLPSGIMLSPRVAPPVFGLGLIEAIDEQFILANADESDRDGNGISGKANYAYNEVTKKTVLGRFGWKAATPTLLQQVASAYNQDMGITNFVFPNESCEGQMQYDNYNDDVEVSDSILYAATFYMQTLAVPARRNADDAIVQHGKQIFIKAQCAACHQPMLRTAVNVAFPEISNQTIFPYSDLLVHDMGGDLADNRHDYLANGYEWRTPPLWGIGLTKKINGHNNYLHDGRARSLIEAVMWHGGEGEQAKEYVRQLTAADRDALVKFLESL